MASYRKNDLSACLVLLDLRCWESIFKILLVNNLKPAVIHYCQISTLFLPIRFSEFVEAYESGTDIRERNLITFDDGYTSAAQKAVPILQKYDIESIWFLNSNFWNNDRVSWLSKLM